jgi:hypothetical protein
MQDGAIAPPVIESTLVDKKGKLKEDLHLASFPLFLLFSFSFFSPSSFPLSFYRLLSFWPLSFYHFGVLGGAIAPVGSATAAL